jgi:hypothetical protein
MIFLIQYNRVKGEIVTMSEYTDEQRQVAENARLELELQLSREGVTHEVVLLEAASEEALRRTHRRYFANLSEIVKSSAGGGL